MSVTKHWLLYTKTTVSEGLVTVRGFQRLGKRHPFDAGQDFLHLQALSHHLGHVHYCTLGSSRRGQVRTGDDSALGQNNCPLYSVLELAHIAWPILLDQLLHGLFRDAGG